MEKEIVEILRWIEGICWIILGCLCLITGKILAGRK